MKSLSMSRPFCDTGFVRSIPSDLSEVDKICQNSQSVLDRQGQAGNAFAVDLLLREYMNNAILHGHHSDIRKRVQVELQVGRKWITLRISDEGPGFNWRAKKRNLPNDTDISGRGLAIGSLYAQRIRYNHAGNQVTLWIRKTEPRRSSL